MSYIGNTPTQQNFVAGADQFSGNGSTVAFTLSRSVNTVFDIFVTVANVPQDPFTAYTVSGNTLTFDGAPPSGTNNIDVVYRATNVQTFVPTPGVSTQLGLGSASAPSLTFIGDTNTGIYSPAADTIAFTEGGVESLRLNSSGQIAVNAAGSASTPTITKADDLNTGIFYPAADTVAIGTGGTEALRVNSSQNVGIGTQSPYTKTEIVNGKLQVSSAGGLGFAGRDAINIYTSAGARISFYDDSNSCTIGSVRNGAASDLTFTTSGTTEFMRLNSSGNLGIGETSPSSQLTIKRSASGALGPNIILNNSGGGFNDQTALTFQSAGTTRGQIISNVDSGQGGSGSLQFWTLSNTGATFNEKARITSTGYFKASSTGGYASGLTGTVHEFNTSAVSGTILNIYNEAASSPNGLYVRFNASPNNTTNYFLLAEDGTNSKCFIYSNGTIQNRTGTYTTISDIKLKQDVVDASSQWNDIKALRIVKYRLKDEVAADPNYPSYIGLIAQEVEQVSPGLVDNCPDTETVEVTDEEGNVTKQRRETGTVTKAVKYSILYMKAVKALQEAMTRIEALEAEVQALKGNA